MSKRVQLQRDAAVMAEDGRKIGSLSRIVVDPDNGLISNLVVRLGSLLDQDEKVVPIKMVAEISNDKILLDGEAGDLEDFAPLHERQFVVEQGDEVLKSSPDHMPVTSTMAEMPVDERVLEADSGPRVVTRVEQNIPDESVAIKLGAKVISADDKHIGDIEAFLAEPESMQITHVQVSHGLLFKEASLIPVTYFSRMNEEDVQLQMNEDNIESALNE
jgi:sporulation protein YlmC with PRC-barrel domain